MAVVREQKAKGNSQHYANITMFHCREYLLITCNNDTKALFISVANNSLRFFVFLLYSKAGVFRLEMCSPKDHYASVVLVVFSTA